MSWELILIGAVIGQIRIKTIEGFKGVFFKVKGRYIPLIFKITNEENRKEIHEVSLLKTKKFGIFPKTYKIKYKEAIQVEY